MDLHLSREQEMLRKMYRDFAENEVKPLAEWVDENEAFPEETVKKMAKLGMMGIYFPKEYGGAGADVLSYVMAVEEMSKVCGTTGVIISAHTSLCCAPIYENGTEEQKKYYLPKLCSGEWIGAFGLTEPGAGTDAQGQQTTAVLDEKGENWILNGSKIFITNAGYANVFVIFAITGVTTDKRGRKKKEISAFIVERTDLMLRGQLRRDGHQGSLHQAGAGGLHYPQGPPAGQAGQGLRHRHEDPGRRPYRYCLPGPGSGRGASRDHQVHQRARPVRPAHLPVPEH